MGWVEARITRNGQISLPAELRRRWGRPTVLVIDCGEYAIVRPVPEDPIGELMGKYAGPGPTSEEMRAENLAEELAAEARREASS